MSDLNKVNAGQQLTIPATVWNTFWTWSRTTATAT